MKLRSVLINTLLIALILCVSSCSDIKVKKDEPGPYFDNYSIFSWHEKIVNRKESDDIEALLNSFIISQINSNLNKKGYREAANPDFLVNYHLVTEEFFDIKKLNVYSGYGPGFVLTTGGEFSNQVMVMSHEYEINDIRKGTLVIDIVDAKQNKLVWRAVAEREFEGRLSEVERENSLRQAVSRMLKDLPYARENI